MYSYDYDTSGRLRAVKRGVAGSSLNTWYTYLYNATQLDERVDNLGNYVRYDNYDALDRLTSYTISDPLSSTNELTYTVTYDTLKYGLATRFDDPYGSQSFTYDNLSRVSSTSRTWTTTPTSVTKTFAMEYDALGRVTETTYPSGITVADSFSMGFNNQMTITHPSNFWYLQLLYHQSKPE